MQNKNNTAFVALLRLSLALECTKKKNFKTFFENIYLREGYLVKNKTHKSVKSLKKCGFLATRLRCSAMNQMYIMHAQEVRSQ